MSRAPKWRVRGGKPKKEQKEGWVLVGRGHPASNRRGLSSGSSLLAEMNGLEGGLVLYFRAGQEVKAIREDCPPSKEDGKKVLSSISTSFLRPWKSRPAQRITCTIWPFVSPTKKSSLTISHSFPAEPPLFAIRCFRLPFL
nr:hypothetical protein HannXRQ_Chr08g0236041 [Ipomoea batatas]